ncbi:hypothetical protein HNY73_012530 [Argiope bruennichi]|uniref:Uncharacterized protein n=1 Tax=Argiope bruennichi TaxID=94029 RepID=A0A8T0EVS2_ARGBR|nr:hypothetical protein HNY73_012530 [Argiope bruennichi]
MGNECVQWKLGDFVLLRKGKMSVCSGTGDFCAAEEWEMSVCSGTDLSPSAHRIIRWFSSVEQSKDFLKSSNVHVQYHFRDFYSKMLDEICYLNSFAADGEVTFLNPKSDCLLSGIQYP